MFNKCEVKEGEHIDLGLEISHTEAWDIWGIKVSLRGDWCGFNLVLNAITEPT